MKIGFICEGESETIIVKSKSFQEFLKKINLDCVAIIDATGNGNLLPKYMVNHLETMKRYKADYIIILTDLDEDVCITQTKSRINAQEYLPKEVFINISVKAIEAWYLADSDTLSGIFNGKYFYELPENPSQPIYILKEQFIANTGRGIGPSKARFCSRMIEEGFSIENAAKHPNCYSAKYFLNRLETLGKAR